MALRRAFFRDEIDGLVHCNARDMVGILPMKLRSFIGFVAAYAFYGKAVNRREFRKKSQMVS